VTNKNFDYDVTRDAERAAEQKRLYELEKKKLDDER